MDIRVAGGRRAKREDFPVDTLRYMEVKLGMMRKVIMDITAVIAEQGSSNADSYRVEPFHVDQALAKFFSEFVTYRNDIGLAK